MRYFPLNKTVIWRQLPVLALLTSIVILAGCGGAGGITPGGVNSAASPPAKPTPTITATVGANGGGASVVTLSLNKSQFAPNDTITVTVTNGGSTDIFAANHQTNCTIISLQILTDGAWQTIHNCQEYSATRLIKIPAGATSVQTLAPGGGQIVNKPWAAGTYRATLGYGPGDTPASNADHVATSATFTVA
ncbi:MAG TPA: hypothetical protein VKQ36_13950 [Ktedonobacterales bacterium]|nr:hypothetical protein [Ktedonobacterales bacterium]